MQNLLSKELGCHVEESKGSGASGCTCAVQGYVTDKYGTVFVKSSSEQEVIDNPDRGSVLVIEYLDIKPLNRYGAELGKQLANLHLHNQRLLEHSKSQESSVHSSQNNDTGVRQFGFHCTTFCGAIKQDNTWSSDWLEYFARQKLQFQLSLIEKEYGDREAIELWSRLQQKLPVYFKDIHVVPSLQHGDLWSGNAAETDDGPVIFDAGCFYGHHEYDFGIAKMFSGFPATFWKSYHSIIPQAPGFSQRNQLYQLFHYLNHWNVFGSGYRESSLSIMRQLCK